MAAFGENIAGKKHLGSGNFAGFDSPAQRERIARFRAEIPYGGKAPAREHLLHVFFKIRCWCCSSVVPPRIAEVHVAIPKSSNNGLPAAIDNARIFGNLDFATLAESGDFAAGNKNDRIRQRFGDGRGVDCGARKSKGRSVIRSGRERYQNHRGEKKDMCQKTKHSWLLFSLA